MKIESFSPAIRRKEMDAVLTAMVEEKIGPGDRNRVLVQTAKEYLHFDYALALRSPAVALFLALKALDVKEGQAVIVSALSPGFYLQVLEDLRLTPLYCDVSFDFPCIGREMIENVIMNRPSGLEICAVVVHHTLGFIADIDSITELGIPVIEDVSQSCANFFNVNESNEKKDNLNNVGSSEIERQSKTRERVSGIFCILGLEEKDMLTSGGGALLFTMNKRGGSMLKDYSGLYNEYSLPDINAALAVVQFKEARRNILLRHEICKVYANAGLRTRHKRFIPLSDDENSIYSFPLVLESGLKDVLAYAKKKEIAVENAFENTIAASGVCKDCPVSNSLVLRTVLFPVYPRLRSQDVERVTRLIMTLP